jgi:ABC-type phosphate transport system substrate-binding protein
MTDVRRHPRRATLATALLACIAVLGACAGAGSPSGSAPAASAPAASEPAASQPAASSDASEPAGSAPASGGALCDDVAAVKEAVDAIGTSTHVRVVPRR